MPSEAAEAAGSSAQAFQACRPLSRGLDHKAAPSPCPTPSASLSIVSSVSWLFMKTRAEKRSQEMIERSGVVGGQPVRNNLRHAAAHKGRGPGTPTAPGYHADRHLRRSLAASMLSRTTPGQWARGLLVPHAVSRDPVATSTDHIQWPPPSAGLSTTLVLARTVPSHPLDKLSWLFSRTSASHSLPWVAAFFPAPSISSKCLCRLRPLAVVSGS